MNDPVSAREIAAQAPEGGAGRWHPPVREWDTHATLLARIYAAVQEVQRSVVATAGGKPGRGEPMPIPSTRVDAERRRLERESVQQLMDELIGLKGKDGW